MLASLVVTYVTTCSRLTSSLNDEFRLHLHVPSIVDRQIIKCTDYRFEALQLLFEQYALRPASELLLTLHVSTTSVAQPTSGNYSRHRRLSEV